MNALLAVPDAVSDAEAAAAQLVELIGGDEAAYLAALTARRGGGPARRRPDDRRARRRSRPRSTRASCPGVELRPVSTVAVAGGAASRSSTRAARSRTVDLERGAAGLAEVSGVDDGSQLYVTTTDADRRPRDRRDRGHRRRAANGPEQTETFRLPGAGRAWSSTRPRSSSRCWGWRPTAPGRPSTSSSRTARASSRTTGCRSRPALVARPQQALPDHQRRRPAGVRGRRRGRVDGRGLVPVRVAAAGRDPGRADRGGAVPAGPRAVPAPRRSACSSGCSCSSTGCSSSRAGSR